MSGITCIIGLANPGSEYQSTRHNAGAWFVQALSESYRSSFKLDVKRKATVARLSTPTADCRLAIPTDFMNLSGDAVQLVSQYYRINTSELLIAHDELDLEPGVIRLKFGGGHGGHNGLRDIINKLGTKDFWRLRIGIGHPGHKSKVTGYVLNQPSKDDKISIDRSIDDAVNVFDAVTRGDYEKAMTALHTQR